MIEPVLSLLRRGAAVMAGKACASPQVFIARLRLETARALLETGRQPIKEITVQSGYLYEGGFRRAFRRSASLG